MSPLTCIVATWTPTAAAWILFGWRGLLWGVISTACAEALRRRCPSLRIITRENNELYLKRWALRTQRRGDTSWRVFLHRFYSHDEDGHHNHPWVFCFSIVLWGSYTEEILKPCRCPRALAPQGCDGSAGCGASGRQFGGGDVLRTRRVRWFNWIPRSRYHRITALHGTVWTLFFAGPRHVDDWGFWMPGRGHIPWRARLRERGLDPQ